MLYEVITLTIHPEFERARAGHRHGHDGRRLALVDQIDHPPRPKRRRDPPAVEFEPVIDEGDGA